MQTNGKETYLSVTDAAGIVGRIGN